MLIYVIVAQLLYVITYVNAYVASLTCPCDILIDDKILINEPNMTYVWLYDNSTIISACNYTLEYISYASLDIIQIYSTTLAVVIIVSCLIFACMSCYIISFWIEKRSRQSRRILRFASY